MTAREELAKIIFNAPALVAWEGQQSVIADAILAAGYRKPRTITTAEELDALPDGSLILDAQHRCREGLTSIEGRNWWRAMGPSKVLTSAEISLPATVLHEGAQP